MCQHKLALALRKGKTPSFYYFSIFKDHFWNGEGMEEEPENVSKGGNEEIFSL